MRKLTLYCNIPIFTKIKIYLEISADEESVTDGNQIILLSIIFLATLLLLSVPINFRFPSFRKRLEHQFFEEKQALIKTHNLDNVSFYLLQLIVSLAIDIYKQYGLNNFINNFIIYTPTNYLFVIVNQTFLFFLLNLHFNVYFVVTTIN